MVYADSSYFYPINGNETFEAPKEVELPYGYITIIDSLGDVLQLTPKQIEAEHSVNGLIQAYENFKLFKELTQSDLERFEVVFRGLVNTGMEAPFEVYIS
jgi:hypothetical protein